MRHKTTVLAGCVAALVLAACGNGAAKTAATPATHTVSATITLTDYRTIRYQHAADNCSGLSGFDDLVQGSPAVLTDENGKTIASTTMANGVASDDHTCVFTVGFSAVPDASFYGLQVGHRNKISESRADLAAAGWAFHVSIG
jgi:hypothetical protein